MKSNEATSIYDMLVAKKLLDESTTITSAAKYYSRKVIRGYEYSEIGRILNELYEILIDYYVVVQEFKIRRSRKAATDKMTQLFGWGESYISRLKKLADSPDYIQTQVKDKVITLGGAESLRCKIKQFPDVKPETVINSILEDTKFRCEGYRVNKRLIDKWFEGYDLKTPEDRIISGMQKVKKKLALIDFKDLSTRNKRFIVKCYRDLINSIE